MQALLILEFLEPWEWRLLTQSCAQEDGLEVSVVLEEVAAQPYSSRYLKSLVSMLHGAGFR